MSNISVVIGSWGSYNECNERALGSEWLDLSDYYDWEEIEAELTKQGFILDGIDEELFIQDIDGLPSSACNWDYTNPEDLFNQLKEADVLDNDTKYETLMAYLENRTFDEFLELVEQHGDDWDDDIYLYRNYDWDDYGRELFAEFGYSSQIPDSIQDFIDFEAYGEYLGQDLVEEYSEGLIEIRR